MANKADLVRKIREKFGIKAEPWTDETSEDTPIRVPNRRDKRRAKQYSAVTGAGEVHDALRRAAFRGRKKTGQPLWFRQMQYEQTRRRALEKVELHRLVQAVGRVAMDLYQAGYQNVWQISEVEDVNTLLLIGHHDNQSVGVSHKELKKLRDYLVSQRVPVKWEA